MGKKTVAVLFGSISSEYEVSLRSAASVLRNIPRDRYDVVMLGITKDGRWFEYAGSIDDIESDRWLQNGPVTPAFYQPGPRGRRNPAPFARWAATRRR